MTITGDLDADGQDLVLTRTLAAPRDRIWAHLSTSALLETWFGTFEGDPGSGQVQVTMTAEPGDSSAAEYTIHACEQSALLTVSSAMGEDTWRLSVELADAGGAEASDSAGAPDRGEAADGAGTVVSLRHHAVPADMVQHIGPGWEWYLDRLTGAVTGGEIPGMDVWDSRYMTLAEDYARLTR